MPNRNYLIYLFLILLCSCKKQNNVDHAAIKDQFLKEQTEFGAPIFKYLNNNFYKINSLGQKGFTYKIDSLRSIYESHLSSYKGKLDDATFKDEVIGIRASFDKYILEYPQIHESFTGNKVVLSKENLSRLDNNISEFNNLEALNNRDFKNYVRAYISHESRKR